MYSSEETSAGATTDVMSLLNFWVLKLQKWMVLHSDLSGHAACIFFDQVRLSCECGYATVFH